MHSYLPNTGILNCRNLALLFTVYMGVNIAGMSAKNLLFYWLIKFWIYTKPAYCAEKWKQKRPEWRIAPQGLVEGSPKTGSTKVIRHWPQF